MNAGSPTMSTAERCSACGRRSVIAGLCSACGASVRPSVQEVAVPLAQMPDGVTFGGTLSPRGVGASDAITIPPAPHSLARQPITRGRVIGSRSPIAVRGRVVIVRQGSNEPMDFDPWRWIAIPTWGLIFLVSPVIAAIVAWQSVGFLGALGVAFVTFFVLRFMFSNRLLQSWYFVSALNGRNVIELMPVIMIRLRQADDREIQLRLKGQLHGGTVIEGDRISASGKWSRGVFSVREISCERTGASIVPRQPTARIWAIAGMCVLFSAALWLRFAGMPWVEQQAHSFQPSARSFQRAVLRSDR